MSNIDSDTFHAALTDLLHEMQEEGKLVAYIMGLGDVMSEVSEDLNNEVIRRIEDDRAMKVDLADQPDLDAKGDGAVISVEDVLAFFSEC